MTGDHVAIPDFSLNWKLFAYVAIGTLIFIAAYQLLNNRLILFTNESVNVGEDDNEKTTETSATQEASE